MKTSPQPESKCSEIEASDTQAPSTSGGMSLIQAKGARESHGCQPLDRFLQRWMIKRCNGGVLYKHIPS
jgi:hypothetical protein